MMKITLTSSGCRVAGEGKRDVELQLIKDNGFRGVVVIDEKLIFFFLSPLVERLFGLLKSLAAFNFA